MTYQFRPAVREQCYTLTGIGGPSGSGKTFSALRLASGLANGGKIAVIDTEANRALHYADQFQFLHCPLRAPFTPENYMGAIQAAKDAGASVIIVDSMSHEHEGPGGILEQHEAQLEKMAGNDFNKREKCKFTAWIKPKRSHNSFVNGVLQIEAHLIFCFRAKEKLNLAKNSEGKIVPTPAGWQPICSDRFEYEMTAMLILPPGSSGMPDYRASATKLQSQHRGIFSEGRQIDEGMGKALAEWSGGTAAPMSAASGNGHAPDPFDEAKAAAEQGVDAFRAWWGQQSKAMRTKINHRRPELKAIAEAADAGADDVPDDPFADEDGDTSAEDAATEDSDLFNGEPQSAADKDEAEYLKNIASGLRATTTAESLATYRQQQESNMNLLSETGQAEAHAMFDVREGELG